MIICYIIIAAAAGLLVYLQLQNRDLRNSVSLLTTSINKEKEHQSRKQSFIATITHDLKTPTNAQINILNLLLRENFGKLNPEQREMLTLTQNSCKYMSDLIAVIMDTYNYECGYLQLNPAEFDVIGLIEKQCKSLKAMTQQNNLEIILHNKYKTLIITADKLQIKRVILNLLSNAITYAYSNSKIIINIKTEDNYFEFSVENFSCPIPEQELKTVFDKFKKTRFSHFNNAGSGLGLYLSKQIIEQHKGKIYAKCSDEGKCIFGFKIPVKHTAEFTTGVNTINVQKS